MPFAPGGAAGGGGGGTTNSVTTVADIPARDALAGVVEGDTARVLDDGNGEENFYIWDGAAWLEHEVTFLGAMEAAGTVISWPGRSTISTTADGALRTQNNAQTEFGDFTAKNINHSTAADRKVSIGPTGIGGTVPGVYLSSDSALVWRDGADLDGFGSDDLRVDRESATVLAVRNGADTAYGTIKAKTPIASAGGNELVTKEYLDPMVEAKAVNYTILEVDYGQVIRSSAAIDFQLPDPAAVGDGWYCYIKEGADVATSNVLRDGAETIDGAASNYSLSKLEAIKIVSDGTNWWLI